MEIIEDIAIEEYGLADRVFVMSYALLAYMIGAGALFWLIFAAGGLAPLGFMDMTYGNAVLALAVNAVLVLAFGVQHSVMARTWFKSWLVRFIPASLERANFVLASGLITLVVIALWQPVEVTVWHEDNILAAVSLQVGYWFGIAYLLSSSFVTNQAGLAVFHQQALQGPGVQATLDVPVQPSSDDAGFPVYSLV